MMLKFLLLALLFISGCAQYTAFTVAAREQASQVADAALEAALYQLCTAATSGAIQRKFGGKTDKLKARMVLCADDKAE